MSHDPKHCPNKTSDATAAATDDNDTNDSPTRIIHNTKNHRRILRYYECAVTLSVIVYWLFVSLIPIYNKYFFKKSLYPYPVATAGIQLLAVAILLTFVSVIHHFYDTWCRTNNHRHRHCHVQTKDDDDNSNKSFSHQTDSRAQQQQQQDGDRFSNERRKVQFDDNLTRNDGHQRTKSSSSSSSSNTQQQQQQQPSWIFGPHYLWKVRWCCPIGILFGLKYGVTNLGLHLVPAPIHLLLQATDLVWTVLGAWWIIGERVNGIEIACLLGCIGGSLCLGWQIMISHNAEQHEGGQDGTSSSTNGSSLSTPLFAIAINLMSPMLLGLCIATLRLACTELMRPDNRVHGTVSSIELTAIKLTMSAAVALILACFMEGGTTKSVPTDMIDGSSNDGNMIQLMEGGSDPTRISWWEAFANLEPSTKLGVLGGSVLISVFQANCTFLTYLTSAFTVGLVGQVKIIPQWILATVFSIMTNGDATNGGGSTTTTTGKLLVLHPTALLGAFLICGSAVVFAYANYRELLDIEKLIEQNEAQMLVSENDEIENGEENDEDDEEEDDIDGGSSAFQSLTHTLSRRRSSSGGGSVVMLSTHSLRVSMNGTTMTKPLFLVTDADLWGEASMRDEYDELEEDDTTAVAVAVPPHRGQSIATAATTGYTTTINESLLNDQRENGLNSRGSNRINYNSIG